jgi:hypothetical protein
MLCLIQPYPRREESKRARAGDGARRRVLRAQGEGALAVWIDARIGLVSRAGFTGRRRARQVGKVGNSFCRRRPRDVDEGRRDAPRATTEASCEAVRQYRAGLKTRCRRLTCGDTVRSEQFGRMIQAG